MKRKNDCSSEYLLEVENLQMLFPIRRGLMDREKQFVHAVDGVSFKLRPGETLGIVGESGCGKSTLGNLIIRLLKETCGRILFDGSDITSIPLKKFDSYRKEMQMVFQDPFSSLNPRKKVFDIIAQPYRVQTHLGKKEIKKNVERMMELVDILMNFQAGSARE